MSDENGMEKLIEVFFIMDKNNDEIVDKDEMVGYCKENNFDMKMVNEWLSKCDTDKDNKITFDEFCRGFGIKLCEMRVEKEERELLHDDDDKKNTTNTNTTTTNNNNNVDLLPKPAKPTKPPGVETFSTHMSEIKQAKIIDKYTNLVEKYGTRSESLEKVSNELKLFLESNFGSIWHVIIINGSFWISYSHEPFCSLQFKHGDHVCNVWRTPAQQNNT